jgi:copper chaperone
MCEKHRQQASASTSDTGAGVSVRVNDMTCGHCAGTIKEAIESMIPGAKVTANPDSKLVSVQGADLARVCEVISLAGYTPESVAKAA